MRPFWIGFVGVLGRLIRTPRYRIMTLLTVLGAWVAMEAYRVQVVKELPVGILDLDNSSLSRNVYKTLAAMQEVRVVHAGIQSKEDAKQKIASGEITGLLVIPSDFSQQIKRGRTAKLLAGVDMSNILVGKTVTKAMKLTAGLIGAGIQINVIQKKGSTYRAALARVAPIVIHEDRPFNPYNNYGTYLVPGLVFFFLHVFLLLIACSIFQESNRPDSTIGLVGALTAVVVVGLLLCAVAYSLYLPRASLHVQSDWALAMALTTCFLIATVLMTVAVQAVVAKPFLAMETLILVGTMSLMLSGITWPTDMFPPVLAYLSKVIPFVPFAKGLQIFVHQDVGWTALADNFLLLAMQSTAYSVLIVAGRLVHRRLRLKSERFAQ